MKVKKMKCSGEKGSVKYIQRFRDEWLDSFSPWLARCLDDDEKPYCIVCKCRLDCNRTHLLRHSSTVKHARFLEILIDKGELKRPLRAIKMKTSSLKKEKMDDMKVGIRQERIKYYQREKKEEDKMESFEITIDNNEEYVDEPEEQEHQESGTNFEMVQTEELSFDGFTSEDVSMKEEHLTDLINETDFNHKPSQSVKPQKKVISAKRKNTTPIVKNDQSQYLRWLRQTIKDEIGLVSQNEKNPLDMFFDSVSQSIKALSPKLIAEAKMRVSQLVCELELRALTDDDTSVATNSMVVSTAPIVQKSFIINQRVPEI